MNLKIKINKYSHEEKRTSTPIQSLTGEQVDTMPARSYNMIELAIICEDKDLQYVLFDCHDINFNDDKTEAIASGCSPLRSVVANGYDTDSFFNTVVDIHIVANEGHIETSIKGTGIVNKD